MQIIGNIEVINNWWFSGADTVGVVLGRDQITAEYKFYIGIVRQRAITDENGHIQFVFPANSEEQDIEYIVRLGAKFSQEGFMGIVSNMLGAITSHQHKIMRQYGKGESNN